MHREGELGFPRPAAALILERELGLYLIQTTFSSEFGKLRALIDDRLFKIRNSLDIDGNFRRLNLWDPPLDVGALVNAVAGAGSFSKLLQQIDSMSLLVSGLGQVLPRQRFSYLLHKTFELCEELRRTAGSLLLAIEKKDSEALQLLRGEQDATLQRIMTEMKESQKAEAERRLEQLGQARRAAAHRLKYYSDLSGDDVKLPTEDEDFLEIEQNIVKPKDPGLRLTGNELLELQSAHKASHLNDLACDQDMMAGLLAILPMPSINMEPMGVGASEQLPSPAAGFQIEAGLLRGQAQRSAENGQRANMIGQWTRQLQDRRLQLNLAGLEVKNIDKQMETQRERIKAIEIDIRAQKQIIDAASEMQQFLKSKFSNKELYGWLETSSRSLYYQTYLAAMTLARKLETAYQFEVGRSASSPSGSGTSTSMISPTGYWNESHGGLQAGEQLWLALKQMEVSYMNTPRHDFEMTKNISLRQLDAEAMLSLRELGKATFSLPEMLFDLDCPGHYFRRIQSVAFSLYCVAGPYTNISCNATLVDHRYRYGPGVSGGYGEKSSSIKPDPRFLGQTLQLPISSVALSTGQLDAGVFELNFAGEEYQPFEGAGAISTWELRLPEKYTQFDYKTINDVIIHFRYTSKNGGERLRSAVGESLETSIKDSSRNTQTALFDMKNDAPDAWYQLVSSSSESVVAQIRSLRDRLPYLARSQTIKVTSVKIYTGGQDLKTTTISLSSTKEQAFSPSAVTLTHAHDLGKLEVFTISANGSGNLDFILTNQWHIALKKGLSEGERLAAEEFMILLNYKFV